MGFQLSDMAALDLSVAMTTATDRQLAVHLHKPRRQEDLAFAYWVPSRGSRRYTAIITALVLPEEGERILRGNVAFLAGYLDKSLGHAWQQSREGSSQEQQSKTGSAQDATLRGLWSAP